MTALTSEERYAAQAEAKVEHVKGERGRPAQQAHCGCGWKGDRTTAEFARQQAEGHKCGRESVA